MVRHGQVHRALLTLAAVSLALPALAQTLTDAAKRAKEQRQESATPPLVISKLPETPDSGPIRLTADVLMRYARARRALADLRRADSRLHSRLLRKFRSVRHYDEVEPLYGAEPDVVALFRRFDLTVGQYFDIEAAIWRGRDYDRYARTLSREMLSKREAENVDFVIGNMYLVDDIWRSCESHEQGLGLIGVIPSWR